MQSTADLIARKKDTIVALSTAPGVGAIALIRLSGEQAIEYTQAIFKGKDLSEVASHSLHFGKIYQKDEIIDEVVLGLYRNPRSYTKEDVV
ncbi:MAG: tRNA uridine-5-carboxymethylaminomethyl(34) synthesis GTPase MnmE, partial [Bacteroidota bacterium]